jgi:hypothetical protein
VSQIPTDFADLGIDALLSELDPESAPETPVPSPPATAGESHHTEERRAARRWDPSELSGDIRLTIPGVANVLLVNISETGVLIETSCPLKPGMTANLFVRLNGKRHALRAVTVRSALHTITSKSEAVYRTALRFDTPLALDTAQP